MIPQAGVKVYETEISYHWIDEQGIVCSVSKAGNRFLRHFEETFEIYAKLTDGKKRCLLADSNNTGTMSKELRDYVTAQLPNFFKAMAVLSKKPLQASLANVFLRFSWKRFPIKLFTSEAEARKWLKDYM